MSAVGDGEQWVVISVAPNSQYSARLQEVDNAELLPNSTLYIPGKIMIDVTPSNRGFHIYIHESLLEDGS